ncbi:MAG: asparaginase, partial [Rhodospirillales bacterium]
KAAAGALAVKTGAEGMYVGILPGLGLGVALKIDDGARRASEVAMAALLRFLGALDARAEAALAAYLEAPVLNTPGDQVGVIRMAEGWDS